MFEFVRQAHHDVRQLRGPRHHHHRHHGTSRRRALLRARLEHH
ncbi:hypothetical protein AB4Z09_17825 [Rhodococcus sp. TAF43]|nr:hypothetical protein [Rhodococcus sp. W8901]